MDFDCGGHICLFAWTPVLTRGCNLLESIMKHNGVYEKKITIQLHPHMWHACSGIMTYLCRNPSFQHPFTLWSRQMLYFPDRQALHFWHWTIASSATRSPVLQKKQTRLMLQWQNAMSMDKTRQETTREEEYEPYSRRLGEIRCSGGVSFSATFLRVQVVQWVSMNPVHYMNHGCKVRKLSIPLRIFSENSSYDTVRKKRIKSYQNPNWRHLSNVWEYVTYYQLWCDQGWKFSVNNSGLEYGQWLAKFVFLCVSQNGK